MEPMLSLEGWACTLILGLGHQRVLVISGIEDQPQICLSRGQPTFCFICQCCFHLNLNSGPWKSQGSPLVLHLIVVFSKWKWKIRMARVTKLFSSLRQYYSYHSEAMCLHIVIQTVYKFLTPLSTEYKNIGFIFILAVISILEIQNKGLI